MIWTLVLSCVVNCHSYIRVDRMLHDKVDGVESCNHIWANNKCACDKLFSRHPPYPTFMSKDEKEGMCNNPQYLGCNIHLQESPATYLVTEACNVTISTEMSPTCYHIKEIHIWNMQEKWGRWRKLPHDVVITSFRLN